MRTRTPILLLKTKSTPHDGYDEYFTANNYAPTFIPVLQHDFHTANLARVRELFASGAFDLTASDTDTEHGGSASSNREKEEGRKYGGMIFTSQRAVEAFVQMIEERGLPPSIPPSLPIYTVGPATARSLTSLRDTYLPTATIHGADAGNGKTLAPYILEHYNSLYPATGSAQTETRTRSGRRKPALLFLAGRQRSDVIPTTLMGSELGEEERIEVDEVVVYETGEMGSFEGEFRGVLGRSITAADDDGGVLWVVVFSPSGCEGMLRVLGLGPFGSPGSGAGSWSGPGKRKVFIATIGPTTRDHLSARFGVKAHVCAEKPSPEGVGEGIRRFMDGLELK